MTITNPGNTGKIDGIISSYTGGLAGNGSMPNQTDGKGISDQVVQDGLIAPVASMPTDTTSLQTDSQQGNQPQQDNSQNPYKPADGDTWDAVDAAKARQSSMKQNTNVAPSMAKGKQSNLDSNASVASGGQGFQTGNWKQYTPQGLESYIGNTIGNTIQNWITPSSNSSKPVDQSTLGAM